jgi:hypothetical protein
MLSCYGGKAPDNGFSSAQLLANELDVVVWAFDGIIQSSTDGTLRFYYPIDEDHPDIPDYKNQGEPFPVPPIENNTGG